MIFWSYGFRSGFYNTLGVFIILFSAYLCLTLCLAEISSCLPFSGGSYALARVTAGPLTGFLVGCADRIDLLCNIGLSIMLMGWISTKAMGIPYKYAQVLSWIVIYSMGCFNLWTTSRNRYWWSMAGIAVFYVAILIVFFLSCVGNADFGKGLPVKSDEMVDGTDFLSLFPRCMLFFSGLQFVQVGAVDVKDPKKNIPRLLILGIAFAFLIGITVLFLAASHSPSVLFYSHQFPLAIIPALSSALQAQPKFIALILLPTFFASFQGSLFALQRVSMAMLQSNLLFLARPPDFIHCTDEQYFLIRMGIFIFVGMMVGFVIIRDEWFWIVAQIAMLGSMSSQCANLFSFIVFRMQFGSLERGFVSPLGIAGAVYPFLVFVLVIGGIVAKGRDGRIALAIFVTVVIFTLALYHFKLKTQQRFSAEEEAALFVAHVIRHNAQKGRRMKRRMSRAAGSSISLASGMSFISQGSPSFLVGTGASFRGSILGHPLRKGSGEPADNRLHGSSASQPSVTGESDIERAVKQARESVNQAMALSDANNDQTTDTISGSINPADGSEYQAKVSFNASETALSPSIMTAITATVGETTPAEVSPVGGGSGSGGGSSDAVINQQTPSQSTLAFAHRSASRWQKPKQVISQALSSVETQVELPLQQMARDHEHGGAPPPAAFSIAAQAFLDHTEGGRHRHIDRRKEALIRAFKQSTLDSVATFSSSGHKKSKKVPTRKIVPTSSGSHGVSAASSQDLEEGGGGGGQVGAASASASASAAAGSGSSHSSSSNPGAAPSSSSLSTDERLHKLSENARQKITATATHVLAATHWARLPSLRPLSLLQLATRSVAEEDEEMSVSDRPSQQYLYQPSSEENSRSFSAGGMNAEGSGGSSSHKDSTNGLVIADMKPTDLIDRYYSDEQFNYHAFIDDVFGAAATPKFSRSSKKTYPAIPEQPSSVPPSKTTSPEKEKEHPSPTLSPAAGGAAVDPDAAFAGRKLHRIVLPPELAALNPTPDPLTNGDSFLAEYEVDTDHNDKQADVPTHTASPHDSPKTAEEANEEGEGHSSSHQAPRKKPLPTVITLPSPMSMTQLDAILRIETPVVGGGGRHMTEEERFSPTHATPSTPFSASSLMDNITVESVSSSSVNTTNNSTSVSPLAAGMASTAKATALSVNANTATTDAVGGVSNVGGGYLKRPSPKALPPLSYTAGNSPHQATTITASSTASNGPPSTWTANMKSLKVNTPLSTIADEPAGVQTNDP